VIRAHTPGPIDEFARVIPPTIGELGLASDAPDQQFSGMSLIKALFDSTADHIHVKDLAGRYVLLNQADVGWFARPLEEVLGRTDAELVDPVDAAMATERDRMVMESGNPLTYEQEAVRNGITHTWLTTKNVVRDPAGRIAGLFTISHEITEERRQEAQLRQAAKMEAVGQLAGGIAHDFNNMLTAIRGYAELARTSMPDAGQQALSDIDQIMVAADRAAELTHQLLTFSRRQVLATRLLDPAEMVGAIAPMLRRLLGENIALTLRTAPGLGQICVDPAQLNQVILNLAVNARDAMPDGGRLSIETANAELDREYIAAHTGARAGSHVRLTVSDSGTGMDASTLEHIFEPFYTTKAAGTGLGLATVYGIVKQSDGGIDVYSEPGYGTTFNVYFPRVAGDPKPLSAVPAVGEAATGTETILLVEDEPAVRGFALRALAAVGYTVIEASNGTEAIALSAIYEGEIDLLLTDMIMPGMHGSELSSALTASRRGLRTLFVSGFPEDSIVRDGLIEDGVDYLAKPFNAAALGRAVRSAIDG
jgi:two-component system cell cycle sensor histidine kinase/response regulator CckA